MDLNSASRKMGQQKEDVAATTRTNGSRLDPLYKAHTQRLIHRSRYTQKNYYFDNLLV